MVKCFQSKFWQFLYFIFFHSVAKYLSQGIWLVISEVTRNWFRISEKELSYRNIIYSSALSVHIKTFYHLTSEFEGLYCSLRCTKLLDQSQMHNPEGLEIVIFCNQNSKNFLWIRCGFFLYLKIQKKITDNFLFLSSSRAQTTFGITKTRTDLSLSEPTYWHGLVLFSLSDSQFLDMHYKKVIEWSWYY